MATISTLSPRLPVRQLGFSPQGGVVKCLKIFGVVAFVAIGAGCASGRGTGLERDLLIELEEQNARLEAEVTRLREEKLRSVRRTDCSAQSGEAGVEKASEGAPDDLPVVQMQPSAAGDELEAGDAIVRPAEPVEEEEEPFDENTRPVLKVRGQHEAWVYHRPITAEDRKAKTDVTPKE